MIWSKNRTPSSSGLRIDLLCTQCIQTTQESWGNEHDDVHQHLQAPPIGFITQWRRDITKKHEVRKQTHRKHILSIILVLNLLFENIIFIVLYYVMLYYMISYYIMITLYIVLYYIMVVS